MTWFECLNMTWFWPIKNPNFLSLVFCIQFLIFLPLVFVFLLLAWWRKRWRVTTNLSWSLCYLGLALCCIWARFRVWSCVALCRVVYLSCIVLYHLWYCLSSGLGFLVLSIVSSSRVVLCSLSSISYLVPSFLSLAQSTSPFPCSYQGYFPIELKYEVLFLLTLSCLVVDCVVNGLVLSFCLVLSCVVFSCCVSCCLLFTVSPYHIASLGVVSYQLFPHTKAERTGPLTVDESVRCFSWSLSWLRCVVVLCCVVFSCVALLPRSELNCIVLCCVVLSFSRLALPHLPFLAF
jgi:hypothetical protein